MQAWRNAVSSSSGPKLNTAEVAACERRSKCAQPGQQLGQLKRLGHVVICTHVQPLYPVLQARRARSDISTGMAKSGFA
jgi:hypothetical protein